MERLTERWGEDDVWVKDHDYVSVAHRLAAYEDTGLEPEEVLPKDKADEIALKLMRLVDLENFAVTPTCGSWPRLTRTGAWLCCRARWETNYGASAPTSLRGFTALP